jgi:predicted transposase YbfD/YdcC
MTNIDLFVHHLSHIKDYRHRQGQRYKLHHLLTIMVLSTLSGSDDFESMALFCKEKSDYLHEKNLLVGGKYPSHDLFRLVMMHLDKSVFGNLLSAWLESQTIEVPNEQKYLQIDGKVLRATRTYEHSRTALTLLNAYCSNHQLTVGELLLEKKSSEKTAIPVLLDMLELSGSVVTIDAIGTTTATAQKIRAKKGDYILALKKNHKLLYQDVVGLFESFSETNGIIDVAETIENQGIRTDIRKASVLRDFTMLPDAPAWAGLQTITRIQFQRTIGTKITKEEFFYLSSLDQSAEELMKGIRRHWSVENQLHWHLDVTFHEDQLRLKERNAAFCMAILRRFALTLLKKVDSKESIKARRLAAAWNPAFLDKVLIFNDIQFS